MPKYGQDLYAGNRYGGYDCQIGNLKRTIGGVEQGFAIRGSIGDRVTFRGRRGNGYFGALLGRFYQDKYKYFIPSSINNPEGAAARAAFATAVSNWKNTLTNEEKADYNKRAMQRGKLSGYNLYIREYVKANT
jgi:hypothetical protein